MAMTLKEFDKLSHRDFTNGAVLDEIADVFKENERLRAEVEHWKAVAEDGGCWTPIPGSKE